MTQDKAPEWAMTKSLSLRSSSDLLTDIALALSQAYERGQESMRERAARLIDEGFERQGARRKLDECDHGRFGYEDCEQCAAAAIRSLPIEQEKK